MTDIFDRHFLSLFIYKNSFLLLIYTLRICTCVTKLSCLIFCVNKLFCWIVLQIYCKPWCLEMTISVVYLKVLYLLVNPDVSILLLSLCNFHLKAFYINNVERYAEYIDQPWTWSCRLFWWWYGRLYLDEKY